MGACSTVFLILITILLPPVGVYIVAGCGADLLINLGLCLLGYIPGHIHAFYLEYVYFDRRAAIREGRPITSSAPGIYSKKLLHGPGGYGTVVNPTTPAPYSDGRPAPL